MRDLFKIPEGLPVPIDDHTCDHLVGLSLPSISLMTTSDRAINLKDLQQPTVIFFYPRTGDPNNLPPVDWDLVPGARGCTPQSCGFRDLYKEFADLGFQVFGCSSQDTEYQKEFVKRNHIPFEILSDSQFHMMNGLNLPTFQFSGMRLIKRMA